MKKIKSKKIIAILLICLIIISMFSKYAFATEIDSALIQAKADCGQHLQYWDDTYQNWFFVKTTYVTHTENGREYPAYCLNRDLPGVETYGDYTVDINSVLDNVQIWRAIINGYPYQTPSQMGVENELDAFVATKQAIYCIIYGFTPETRFRGGDDRGTRIANEIVNLVNIGRYGQQTPVEGVITMSTKGNLYEENNYWVQCFNVNCNVDIQSYQVTSTENLPKGAIITNRAGVETNIFNGNEDLYLKIPKDSMSEDIKNATINIIGKCKTYPVFYGHTRIPNTQDYAVTYDMYGDVFGKGILNLKTNTGKIKINKTDDETKEPIECVKFNLVRTSDGQVISSAVTDKNGVANFSNLYQGKYKLVEVETAKDYVLNEKEFDVDVEYNKTMPIQIENEHKKGKLKIYKVDKDNHKVALKNVEFQLYSYEFDKIIGTYYTDNNGEILIDNLRTGKYALKETKTDEWYLLDNTEKEIEIKWDETSELQVENEKIKLEVDVEKTGFVETQSKDSIYYNFKNIRNNSNVSLDNFTWKDTLPTQALRINKIYTGTWNEDLKYSIWYKTNKNDYRKFKENVSTQINNEINFKELQLAEDEYVTEYEFRFGKVKIGFSEVEQPILYCDMLDRLGNGFVFTNYTKVSGNYEDKYVEKEDKWTTVTYSKEIQNDKKLPRTGI